MTPVEFTKQVELSPGEVIQYHRGVLGCDMKDDPSISAIANTAWQYAVDGKVYLLQRRLKKAHVRARTEFEYLAVVPKEGGVPHRFRAKDPVYS